MQELLRENPEFKEYFDSLPKFVQETLTQSSGLGKTEEELRSVAENLMRKHKKQ